MPVPDPRDLSMISIHMTRQSRDLEIGAFAGSADLLRGLVSVYYWRR